MVDYSKWKDIEISDDEDETHPNIDTPSLFRWRHNARLERMVEMKRAQALHNEKKEENVRKIKETNEKITELEKSGCDLTDLKKVLEELDEEAKDLKEQEEDLKKKEKLTPWNVDTISHSGFSKTIVNKDEAKPKLEDLTDEERENIRKQFIKDNKKELKEFGMLQKYEDSKRYLLEHLQLVCENAANYYVIWCLNLQMEGKSSLMEHVAHQCICLEVMLTLIKEFDLGVQECVESFFTRVMVPNTDYRKSFEDELSSFKNRIRNRAEEKLEAAAKEIEEKEKKERLGPGGLDPVEVFESLPDELKKCFESQDIPLLKKTIEKMDPEAARYHMTRCVDSGLWVPGGSA